MSVHYEVLCLLESLSSPLKGVFGSHFTEQAAVFIEGIAEREKEMWLMISKASHMPLSCQGNTNPKGQGHTNSTSARRTLGERERSRERDVDVLERIEEKRREQ